MRFICTVVAERLCICVDALTSITVQAFTLTDKQPHHSVTMIWLSALSRLYASLPVDSQPTATPISQWYCCGLFDQIVKHVICLLSLAFSTWLQISGLDLLFVFFLHSFWIRPFSVELHGFSCSLNAHSVTQSAISLKGVRYDTIQDAILTCAWKPTWVNWKLWTQLWKMTMVQLNSQGKCTISRRFLKICQVSSKIHGKSLTHSWKFY